MKKHFYFMLMLLSFVFFDAKVIANNPIANPSAIITLKEVRFTVLTSGLIRMEWDKTNRFTDQASFVVVNRDLPVPRYSQREENGWLIISTDELELHYKKNSGKFSAKNLSIKYKKNGQQLLWNLDIKQVGNLKGTYRTVDRYKGDTFIGEDGAIGGKIPIEDGLLSTDGWTLIDESDNFLFDNSNWAWVQERKNKNAQDLYFMAYDNNYKKAIKEFTLIAGKVPLPPKYAFGYWWSRYWNYSDNELRSLVSSFEKYNIPLDVLVIDMDWHRIDSIYSPRQDEFNQRQHWTGWEWNRDLFPAPKELLRWIRTKKLKTTLNLHPASGIAPYEASYREFAKAINFNTSTGKNIPWRGSNKPFIEALFDQVLNPMEKDGVDFWWLDWQQWTTDKEIKNLNNTWWLNYLFFSDMERKRDTRPLLYHRWGGLGNHRYQVGFSGDAFICWESLAFQPYFTSTASNVLYSYWSHDLGGHMFLDPNGELDPELYVRWMQYGVFSPMFRTHSSKDAKLNKEVWNFSGEYFDALRNSIELRYQLVPYIYTMARKTYDEGIGLCRPMYYDYPDSEQAYTYKSQYMFGDDIIISPVVAPRVNGVVDVKVWLPEGNDWYEWHTGTMLKGGQELTRQFGLDEYPIYIKAGSIIPMYQNNVTNLENKIDKFEIGVFPGNEGRSILYEDAGNDKNYDENFAVTEIMSSTKSRTQHITIHPIEGSYIGMSATKTYSVKVYGVEMPQRVLVNGNELKYNTLESVGCWNYAGNEFAVIIPIENVSCHEKQSIVVEYDADKIIDVNVGLIKQMRDFSKTYIKYKFNNSTFPGWVVPEVVGACEEINRKIEYEPNRFYENVDYFKNNIQKAYDTLK